MACMKICLRCDTPHCIISYSGRSTFVFSDQNFVSFLSGGAGNCIGIFHGENFSHNDLADFAAKILDKLHLVPGTVILIGSGSPLFKVGPGRGAGYALDWVHLVNQCCQVLTSLHCHFSPKPWPFWQLPRPHTKIYIFSRSLEPLSTKN
jgi:hypothetical protein